MIKPNKVIFGYKPNGEPINGKVLLYNGSVTVVIDYLKEVENDLPQTKGVLKFVTPQPQYAEKKKVIEKYLYDLFLNVMHKEEITEAKSNENRTASDVGAVDTSGTSGKSSGRKTSPTTGKRKTNGVHDSARGTESTETTGRGTQDTALAEGSNSEVGSSGKSD